MKKEFLIGLREGFSSFGNVLASIINFILLLLVYILAIGPTFIVSRIFRKHFLSLKKNKFKETYWIKKQSGGEPIENYYRQF
ncbi:MAG: hypothetical protein PHT54_04795 [Candidatus Nanoarchaeia archaeon]|nr:hypothetical protein [Candidatus Nanoarchaeia archaeon]